MSHVVVFEFILPVPVVLVWHGHLAIPSGRRSREPLVTVQAEMFILCRRPRLSPGARSSVRDYLPILGDRITFKKMNSSL